MKIRKSTPMICRIRESSWLKAVVYLLILNFIDLSANFLENKIQTTSKVSIEDPVDTVSELILEIALDCEEGIIPDNDSHQNDAFAKKIKLSLIEFPSFYFQPTFSYQEELDFSTYTKVFEGFIFFPSPPPDLADFF